MSSNRRFAIYPLLKAQALSGSFVSTAFNMQEMDAASIQIYVTTSANTGLFTIEASNDISNTPADSTFDTITLTPVIAALAGANKTITVALPDYTFRWVRIRFVIGTGTNGSATAYIVGKGA